MMTFVSQYSHSPVSDESRVRVRDMPAVWLNRASRSWGQSRLKMLAKRQGQVTWTMRHVPRQMHLVANQTQLVLELIDDFKSGEYREISWPKIAILAGGLLYTVSPADVIPDAIPVLGALDDLAVLALVTRIVNSDLRRYCLHKGYALDDFFRPETN